MLQVLFTWPIKQIVSFVVIVVSLIYPVVSIFKFNTLDSMVETNILPFNFAPEAEAVCTAVGFYNLFLAEYAKKVFNFINCKASCDNSNVAPLTKSISSENMSMVNDTLTNTWGIELYSIVGAIGLMIVYLAYSLFQQCASLKRVVKNKFLWVVLSLFVVFLALYSMDIIRNLFLTPQLSLYVGFKVNMIFPSFVLTLLAVSFVLIIFNMVVYIYYFLDRNLKALFFVYGLIVKGVITCYMSLKSILATHFLFDAKLGIFNNVLYKTSNDTIILYQGAYDKYDLYNAVLSSYHHLVSSCIDVSHNPNITSNVLWDAFPIYKERLYVFLQKSVASGNYTQANNYYQSFGQTLKAKVNEIVLAASVSTGSNHNSNTPSYFQSVVSFCKAHSTAIVCGSIAVVVLVAIWYFTGKGGKPGGGGSSSGGTGGNNGGGDNSGSNAPGPTVNDVPTVFSDTLADVNACNEAISKSLLDAKTIVTDASLKRPPQLLSPSSTDTNSVSEPIVASLKQPPQLLSPTSSIDEVVSQASQTIFTGNNHLNEILSTASSVVESVINDSSPFESVQPLIVVSTFLNIVKAIGNNSVCNLASLPTDIYNFFVTSKIPILNADYTSSYVGFKNAGENVIPALTDFAATFNKCDVLKKYFTNFNGFMDCLFEGDNPNAVFIIQKIIFLYDQNLLHHYLQFFQKYAIYNHQLSLNLNIGTQSSVNVQKELMSFFCELIGSWDHTNASQLDQLTPEEILTLRAEQTFLDQLE